MKDILAERLLAEIMEWEPEDISKERPVLQALAEIKYNEYQYFSPGMRFVESFALWLRQFKTIDERRSAYNFVRERLIFFSNTEIDHFVSISYQDYIEPLLICSTAEIMGISSKHISKIVNSRDFRILKRQCLFLGLSDGAHIDAFRRHNNVELSNEQIWMTYDISSDKAEDMKQELRNDIKIITDSEPTEKDSYFKVIFLLDDFSGSGYNNIHPDNAGSYEGKVVRSFKRLEDNNLIDSDDLEIYIVLYIATEKAYLHMNKQLNQYLGGKGISYKIIRIQKLSDTILVSDQHDKDFVNLIEAYYDPKVMDRHTGKGGTDVKYGFFHCSLPLILSHNTPNNSIFLLWAHEDCEYRGLFPRISRHKS